MINKEKLGLFIVMSSLLFFIIKLHKKHFEQFRLLNCDLSKADTSLSDQDFLCCQAKNFLEEHNEEDGHPSYSDYKNVWDQCNKISTIDLSHDKYMMSDRNAYYDSLEVIYDNLVKEYNDTLSSYSNAQVTFSNLENSYNTEFDAYNVKLAEFNEKSDEYADLISINSNLNKMSEMHEYKLALQSLDDVINKQVQTEMGVSMDMGLKDKEGYIQSQIERSLQNALDYIPKLTDLYIHNVHLFESIQKTRGLAFNETHETDMRNQLIANIESSEALYRNSITLLNKSETTLYSISQSIKELSNYLYQTRDVDQTLETTSHRNITVHYLDQDITLIFRDGKYILPETISTVNMIGAEYISEFLFKQCSINPTTRVATCGNLPISGTKALEEDIALEYKKQPINDGTNSLSSTFFSTFLRYMERELLMNNTIGNTETDLDKTFAYAFLLKTFSDTTGSGSHSPSVDALFTEEETSS
jgi:hypothetical protein